MTVRELAHTRTGAVIIGATVLVTLGGVGGAVAANTVGSRDIRNGAVHSVDIATSGVHKIDIGRNAVGNSELTATVKARLNSRGLTGLEADGPFPSLTDLQEGDNSTAAWVADGGTTVQKSWVMCAPGKSAIGGGFSPADHSAADIKNLQIVSSRPANFANGVETANSIPGDLDQSIAPNTWVVEGFNIAATGGTALVVRPWVVCANTK
jgi:hypothetical protein